MWWRFCKVKPDYFQDGPSQLLVSRYPVQDTHEPRLKVKDENVGWKHTYSGCSHAGFERIGSRSGYNPVQDIYILQRPSSCDPHFRYRTEYYGRGNTPGVFGTIGGAGAPGAITVMAGSSC